MCMSHRPITISQTTCYLGLLLPPLVTITKPISKTSSSSVSTTPQPTTPMENCNFITWDSRSPLVPSTVGVNWNEIPSNYLKALSKFTRG